MDLWGPLRLVLQSIQELQGDSSEFFRDSAIALKARMPLKNVQNCLVVLHENEFISLSKLQEGFSASIEAKGRVALTYPSNVPLITWSGQGRPEGLTAIRRRTTRPFSSTCSLELRMPVGYPRASAIGRTASRSGTLIRPSGSGSFTGRAAAARRPWSRPG